MIREIALWGIGLNMLGVIGLFWFGMPFKVAVGGGSIIVTEATPEGLRAERTFQALGIVSLLLVLSGAGLQALAVWLTP